MRPHQSFPGEDRPRHAVRLAAGRQRHSWVVTRPARGDWPVPRVLRDAVLWVYLHETARCATAKLDV